MSQISTMGNSIFVPGAGLFVEAGHLSVTIAIWTYAWQSLDLAVGTSWGAFPPLLEDVVQPVELDLVLEARVVHLAVGLAAFDQANQAFRLRAGQLLV